MLNQSPPLFTLRHIKRVEAKGRVYYYHRKTRARLPDDPRSGEFVAAVVRENERCNQTASVMVRPGRTRTRSGFVYFLRAGKRGPIKIGTATNVLARVADLQTSHYEVLELAAVVVGGAELERSLHRTFADAHLRGEWYWPHPSLLDHIADLKRTRKCVPLRELCE